MFKASVTIALVLLAAGTVFAETEETGALSLIAEDNEALIVENINGDIVLSTGDSPNVEVEWVIIYDDEDDAGTVQVLHDDSDGLTVWSEWPDEDNVNAEVQIYVSVPSDTPLECVLETVNGEIAAEDCPGSVFIAVVNGDITATGIDGAVSAEIVNGTVDFEDCPGISCAAVVNGNIHGAIATLDGDLDVETVNGNVELSIPDGCAMISIESLSGSIDLIGYEGADVISELVGSYAEFGEGECKVVVCTVSGDVELNAD